MFRIPFILIRILLPIRPKMNECQLFKTFFSIKNIFLQFMRLIFMSVKQKINIFEKCMIFLWFWLNFVDIFHDFGWFFCYPDPDPLHWSGSGSGWPKWNGSETLVLGHNALMPSCGQMVAANRYLCLHYQITFPPIGKIFTQ